MRLLLKWLSIQLFGSFVMSIIVCFLLIGKVKGFYDPDIEKVIFYTILFFVFSLLVGLPILISIYFTISKKYRIKKTVVLLLFMSCIILSLLIAITLFHLDFIYSISMCFSYLPLNIFLFYHYFRK